MITLGLQIFIVKSQIFACNNCRFLDRDNRFIFCALTTDFYTVINIFSQFECRFFIAINIKLLA